MKETSPTWLDELPSEALASVVRLTKRAATPSLSRTAGTALICEVCQFLSDHIGRPAAVLMPSANCNEGPNDLHADIQVIAPDPAFLPPLDQAADHLWNRGDSAQTGGQPRRSGSPKHERRAGENPSCAANDHAANDHAANDHSGKGRPDKNETDEGRADETPAPRGPCREPSSSTRRMESATPHTTWEDVSVCPLSEDDGRLPVLVFLAPCDANSSDDRFVQAALDITRTVWARLSTTRPVQSASGASLGATPSHVPDGRAGQPVIESEASAAVNATFGRPDALLICTTDGVVRYANPAAAAMCQVEDPEDVIGLPMDAYLAPDADPEKVSMRMHRVFVERRSTPPTEYEIVREDGTRRTVEVRSTPVAFNGDPAAEITIRDVTRQRSLERRLQETEERIARLIENAQPIVFILDEDGHFIVFEGRDLASTPYESGELVGQSVFDVYAHAPDLLGGVRRAFGGETVDEVITLDGNMYDVWVSPITGIDGMSSGCIGMAVDITERMQAEESLRTERDLLSRIFETSPVAITVLDNDGSIKQANARAQEVLGLTPSDLQDRSYDDPAWHHTTVSGDPLPDEEQPFRMVKETQAPVYDVRHAIEWPDGRRRILSINGAPLRDGTGTITGAVFVVEDVTAEYRRRRVARQRQEKVRALYEAVSSLLTLDTPEAVAHRMLKMIEATMAYEISAVRLRSGDVLEPTSITDGVRRHMSRPRPAYEIDGPSVVARAYRDGETRMYADVRNAEDNINRGNVRSVAYIPIAEFGIITVGTTHPGGLSAFDVQLVEILARNAETVLRRLSGEAELRRARDVAEEASRLKSAMLANMSHEVRTPLTSILGFAEIIEDESAESSSKAFARRIRMGSQRLRDTLDSVLHLARLEADAMTPQLQPVDLAAEVRATRNELAPMAEQNDVRLVLQRGPDRVFCSTDRFAAQRIVRNLVGNAIKFTEPGGQIQLTVAGGRKGAVVEVSDTGIGMTENFQRRMFDAFTQESEGIRREHEGSGLGLAIVHKLIDLVGGRIEVESTRGHGTRVAVFFPGIDAG